MYLKELFLQSKIWFTLVAIFIVFQLVNNLRQDVAISPVYQYGMYSAPIPPRPLYSSFEVKVNGRVLRPEHYTVQQWDKIILPLVYYSNAGCNNKMIYDNNIRRLLSYVGITADPSNFIYPYNRQAFLEWYRLYLSSFIGEEAYSVEVNVNKYRFDSSFQKSDQASLVNLCK